MGRWIKICGVTSPEDAELVADAGADAIGLNFAPESPRRVTLAEAEAIAERVRDRVELVAVFVNALEGQIRDLQRRLRFDRLQLHGDEAPALLRALGPRAYKAFRVRTEADLAELSLYPGPWHLLDARAPGAYGGTGQTFDWTLVRQAKQHGEIILAGGLTPENVADALRVAEPFGVDTASGVERAPGVKDPERVRAFVRAIRALDEAPDDSAPR